MTFLPVVERELRVGARKPRSYWIRLATAALAILLFGITALFGRWTSAEVFKLLAWSCFLYCLFAGAFATADALSSEKREETLGLLFLTDLRGFDVVLGKLFANSLDCLFGLGAMLPVLAIPIMLGGVHYLEFFRIALCLANTLLLSLSVGLLASAMNRNALRATTIALVCMCGIGFLIPLVSVWFDSYWKWRSLAALVRLASPLYTQTSAFLGGGWTRANQFWWSLLVIVLLALASLGMTWRLTTLLWRETSGPKLWTQMRSLAAGWDKLTLGRGTARRVYRGRLLNRNPFAWLAGRQMISSPGILICLFVVVCLVNGLLSLMEKLPGGMNTEEALTFWVMVSASFHGFALLRMAGLASQRLGEDRRSGTLELVLGTDLSVRDIVRGQWQAIRRQMLGPALITLLVHAWVLVQLLTLFPSSAGNSVPAGTLLYWSFRNLLSWTPGMFGSESISLLCVLGAGVVLVGHWIALGWVGMWLALRLRNARFAPFVALGIVLVPPWLLFAFGVIGSIEYVSIWPEERWLLMCIRMILGFHLINDLGLSFWAARQLQHNLRIAALDRFAGEIGISTFKRLKRIGLGLTIPATAAVLLALFHWEENWRGRRAWDRLQRETAERGESLKPEGIGAENVSADQNFVRAPIVAGLFAGTGIGPAAQSINVSTGPISLASVSLSLMRGTRGYVAWDEQRSWSNQKMTDLEHWRTEYRTLGYIPTNANPQTASADILLAFQRFAGPLDELQTASQRPYCQFRDPNLPWLRNEALCNVSEVIRFRASAFLAEGEVDRAFQDAKLGLFLAVIEKGDRDLLGSALQPIWEGLKDRRWTPDEIDWFRGFLSKIDLLSEYAPAARRLMLDQMSYWESRRTLRQAKWRMITRLFSPIGRNFQNQVALYRYYQNNLCGIIDPRQRRIYPTKANAAYQIARNLGCFSRWTEDQQVSLAWRVCRVQTAVNLGLVACALERYRVEHDEYPPTLSPLQTGGYLDQIPNDLIDGQPLRYQRIRPTDFILYSIGTNGQDDGGSARNEADWVWKYHQN